MSMKEEIKLVNKKTGFVAIVKIDTSIFNIIQSVALEAVKMLEAEGLSDIEISIQ